MCEESAVLEHELLGVEGSDFSNYEQPEFKEECSAIYRVRADRRGRLSMLFEGE
jgi:hypothetical protein